MSRSNTIGLVGATVYVEEDYPNRFLSDLLWEVTLRRDSPVTPVFLADFLATNEGRRLIRSAAMGSSGSMKKLSMRRLRALEVPAPPSGLQHAWEAIRRSTQSVVVGLNAVLIAKRKLKCGLMQELLTGQRRFPEFGPTTSWIKTSIGHLPSDWQAVSLRTHARELSTRNRGGMGEDRVMGVIKGIGLEPMRDHVRASDLSRYKVVPPDGFAYNPMRLNIGSIARNCFMNPCLVSPDYVVFQTNGVLLPEFLDHLRHSHLWQQFVYAAGAGSVRVRIYYRDLSRIVIPLPPLEEQRRIADVLTTLDREIDLLVRQKECFEDQKHALMRRFLSSDVAGSGESNDHVTSDA